MRIALLFVVGLRLCGQTDQQIVLSTPIAPDTSKTIATADPPAPTDSPDGATAVPSSLLPTPKPLEALVLNNPEKGVDWAGLLRASGRFLAIEHTFRLLTEPGTRSGLEGSFFGNYARAVGNLHGWADGDEFYVNYVGHPMQGSVAGFLFVGNDRAYRRAEFGRNRLYWRSRLRAAAFMWAYSEQFEIGLFSEASIGAIQASFPQQGFVDHVVTPAIGLGWMITEDTVDRYLIERIEGASANRFLRLAARSALNPSRTFANVLQGNVPWHRDTRAGILSYVANDRRNQTAERPPAPENRDVPGPAPFEFATKVEQNLYPAAGISCLGGAGSAALRLSENWQFVTEIGGCKMLGLENNLSGDSLIYMIGPRWRSRDWGRWSANLQVLVGGNKLTEERMYPQLKSKLEAAAAQDPRSTPPAHSDYTDEIATNGFALKSGGGVNYKLNAALTLRVAELMYQHSWTSPLWGRSYNGSVSFSSGLVLRMGTW